MRSARTFHTFLAYFKSAGDLLWKVFRLHVKDLCKLDGELCRLNYLKASHARVLLEQLVEIPKYSENIKVLLAILPRARRM